MIALNLRKVLIATIALPALAGVAAAQKNEVRLRANDVLAAESEDELAFSKSRIGDEFSAHVEKDRDIPRGTRVEGRVLDIVKRKNRPQEMRLEFTRMILPDGTRAAIRAVPIAWSERFLTKDADGRFTAKPGVSSENYVLGGIAGGLLIGSLAKKPFEGAFIGAIAGILLSESDKANSGDVVIRRGDKLGVLIERDVTLSWDSRDDLRGSGPAAGRRNVESDSGRDVVIEFDGRELDFGRQERPFEDGSVVMAPLMRVAKQLGLTVQIDDTRDFILIEGDGGMAKLSRTSREYRLNETHKTLSRNVYEKGGVLYIPLEVLKPLTRGTIKVNGTKLEDRP